MKIIVTKDKVKIEEFDVIHEGEHKVNKCSFSFTEDFTEDLVKKAIFTLQNDSIEVPIINNECDIPTEILKARNIVLIGVYAYKVTEDKLDLRYSPSPDAFKVNSGSYIEGASESEEIMPSQFEQYMQALNDGLNKVEASLKKMDEATSSATSLVDEINKKLQNGDFIGPEGPQGQQGIQGVPGKDGTNGTNGQDGLTPSIGDNGNWFIGDVDTGNPSRGEVGPSPDLTDYVKNTDYATGEKGGVVKVNSNSITVNENGYLEAQTITQDQYNKAYDSEFISKGTLENIKDNYVGSSTPVQDLISAVTNIQDDQDENKPKQTASGEIVSVDDALSYKTFNVTVDGASEQITTTGKNLFDTSSLLQTSTVIGTSTGNIYTLKPNTQYTISTNIVSNPNSTNGIDPMIGDPQNNNAYVFVSTDINIEDVTSNNQGVGTLSNKAKTITTDSTGNLYIGLRGGFTDEFNTLVGQGGYIQIEEGSTATSYEPYTGGQPSPSPDYPQEITTLSFDKITRCGKNLATENFANQNSSINLARTLKKGEKITIVLNMTATDNPPSGYGINIYDQDNEQLWGNSYANWQQSYDGWNSFVVTVKNDTSRLRINSYGYQEIEIPTAVLSGALVVENKYVNDGSLYEPYQGQTYDIDLQGNEMVELPNGVKDELVVDKYGNVNLIKNIGKKILNGSEEWIYDNQENDIIQWKVYLGDSTYNNDNEIRCMSDYFIGFGFNDSWYTNNTICLVGGKSMRINTNRFQTVEELKVWLSEHNVTVYYQLANPQPISLGKLSDIITTLNGTNNISINGNIPTTISTTYALDIKKYIDKKIAELSAQLIKGE